VRQPRIKISPIDGEAVYHCTSRTVNGEWLFDDVAKEILRQHLWQLADYCGVQICTYTIMENHYHALVYVPLRQPVSDSEMLRRYAVLHPRASARLSLIEHQLAENGIAASEWRERQLAMMGDVSQFMKLLKQRFSIWYNKAHDRFGTLWAERFKSALIEVEKGSLRTLAAYIDLNSVRAGLATDPKNYRFCGYAEAVAGSKRAQDGLSRAMTASQWTDVQEDYRTLLFGTGTSAREGAASISFAHFERVIAEGGTLPLATVLRCRIRYFADGAVLGTRAFVQTQLAAYAKQTGRRHRGEPHPLPQVTEWGDLATLRRLRQRAFG
jgi:putative transposase